VDFNPVLSQVSFSDFLEQVQDGLFITDRERRIVYWNRAAEELTGFMAAEVVGKCCTDILRHRSLFGESLCVDESCPVLRSMETDIGGTVPQILLMNSSSGRPLPVSLSVGPLHSPEGGTIGAIALLRGMRDEYQQRKLATEIQKRMITRTGFQRNGVRVDTLFVPVGDIGGDFIEAFFLDERTLIATVADATGHGTSASLFTMVFKTLLHSSFAHSRTPGEVLGSINRGYMETAGVDGYYLGACLVSIDLRARAGRYAAAGHPAGLVFARNGDGYTLKEKLKVASLMVGVAEHAAYGEIEFGLGPGEILLLASDGLFEAPCGEGKLFGVEGIEEFFARDSGNRPLEDLLAEVRRRSTFFPLSDDLSAVLIAPQ